MNKEREYLNLIYQYYPKNMYPGDGGYEKSKQYLSLLKLCESGIGKSKMDELMSVLEKKYGDIEDNTHMFSGYPCYRIRIHIAFENKHNFSDIVVNISILTNVFSIYKATYSMKEGERRAKKAIVFDGFNGADKQVINYVKAQINKTFVGYDEFPISLVEKKVPSVAPISGGGSPGEATMFHCVFTDHIW